MGYGSILWTCACFNVSGCGYAVSQYRYMRHSVSNAWPHKPKLTHTLRCTKYTIFASIQIISVWVTVGCLKLAHASMLALMAIQCHHIGLGDTLNPMTGHTNQTSHIRAVHKIWCVENCQFTCNTPHSISLAVEFRYRSIQMGSIPVS